MFIYKREPISRQEVADAFDNILTFLASLPADEGSAARLVVTRSAVEKLIGGEAPKVVPPTPSPNFGGGELPKLTHDEVLEYRRNLAARGERRDW